MPAIRPHVPFGTLRAFLDIFLPPVRHRFGLLGPKNSRFLVRVVWLTQVVIRGESVEHAPSARCRPGGLRSLAFLRKLSSAGLFVALCGACTALPSLEGTRCREPDVPCSTGLDCVGGLCSRIEGAQSIVCEGDAACGAADPRRPYCLGTANDVPFALETFRDNFCAGCGSDVDCVGAVCVQGGSTWYCIGCTDDSHCDTGLCSKNVCRSCKSDAQCASGRCDDGRCVACSSDAECPSTGRCLDGVCRSCANDGDCCGPDALVCVDETCRAPCGRSCHDRRCVPGDDRARGGER